MYDVTGISFKPSTLERQQQDHNNVQCDDCVHTMNKNKEILAQNTCSEMENRSKRHNNKQIYIYGIYGW